jgi:hypothetical protein
MTDNPDRAMMADLLNGWAHQESSLETLLDEYPSPAASTSLLIGLLDAGGGEWVPDEISRIVPDLRLDVADAWHIMDATASAATSLRGDLERSIEGRDAARLGIELHESVLRAKELVGRRPRRGRERDRRWSVNGTDLARSLSGARRSARQIANESRDPGARSGTRGDALVRRGSALAIESLLAILLDDLQAGWTDDGIDGSRAPEPPAESTRSADLHELLHLEVDPAPGLGRTLPFTERLEILLAQAGALLEDGALDFDPQLLRLVERDRDFLRAEAYETESPFGLGESLGAIVARLEGNLLLVAQVPEQALGVLERVIDATARDAADLVPDVVDAVLAAARLDDPEWLAAQEFFDAYQSEIEAIREIGPQRWLLAAARWWTTDEAAAYRGEAAIGGTIGAALGPAIGLIVAAFSSATMGTVVAVGAPVGGAVLGASLSWFFGRYAAREVPGDQA